MMICFCHKDQIYCSLIEIPMHFSCFISLLNVLNHLRLEGIMKALVEDQISL